MLFWQPWFLDQWHYRCNMGIIFKAFPLHQQILHLLLCSAVLTSSLFLLPNSALGSFIRGHASLNCILSDNINPFCCFHKVCYRLLLLTSCILNFYLFFLHQAQQMLYLSGSVNILCDDSSDATWVLVSIKFTVSKSKFYCVWCNHQLYFYSRDFMTTTHLIHNQNNILSLNFISGEDSNSLRLLAKHATKFPQEHSCLPMQSLNPLKRPILTVQKIRRCCNLNNVLHYAL